MELDEMNKNFEQGNAQAPEKKSLGNVEVAPEKGVGQIPKVADENATRARIEKNEQLNAASSGNASTAILDENYRSDSYKVIEGILEEDLGFIYEELPPYMQKDFKEKADIAALEIEKLLQKAKVNIRKVVKIIIQWLRIIPGINKFYLEQEAKIKADKILIELHKK